MSEQHKLKLLLDQDCTYFLVFGLPTYKLIDVVILIEIVHCGRFLNDFWFLSLLILRLHLSQKVLETIVILDLHIVVDRM